MSDNTVFTFCTAYILGLLVELAVTVTLHTFFLIEKKMDFSIGVTSLRRGHANLLILYQFYSMFPKELALHSG